MALVMVLSTAVASGAPAFERTIEVTPGTRLELSNRHGSVMVRAWDRPAVRVSANAEIEVGRNGSTIEVRASSQKVGPEYARHLEVSVPRDMTLSLSGWYTDFTVEGGRGALRVTSREGTVTVATEGPVDIRSRNGAITVRGGRERLELRTTAAPVSVEAGEGAIVAASVSGDVLIGDRARATALDLTTLSGRIRYAGPLIDDGPYTMSTHTGAIELAVPAASDATITAMTIHGRLHLPPTLKVVEAPPEQRFVRKRLVMGNGRAVVELRSFDGPIRITAR